MNTINLTEAQQNLVSLIGTELYKALNSNESQAEALSQFNATELGRNPAILEIQPYDEIHLAFFKFQDNPTTHIVAIGDFTCQSFTIFNRFESTSVAENVDIWSVESGLNPILNFRSRINDYPTVENEALSSVLDNGDFVVEVISNDPQSREYSINGVQGTISEGVSIQTEILEDNFYIDSLTVVISKFSSDSFHIVSNNEIVSDEKSHELFCEFIWKKINELK